MFGNNGGQSLFAAPSLASMAAMAPPLTGTSATPFAFGTQAGSGRDSSGGMMTQGGGAAREPVFVMPVTLKMLATADREGDKSILHGKTLTNILCVGMILGIDRNTGMFQFKIDDSTAMLQAKWYYTDLEPAVKEKGDSLQVGQHVRIMGSVRNTPGGTDPPSISIMSVDLIEDPAEIPFHITRAIHVGLMLGLPWCV